MNRTDALDTLRHYADRLDVDSIEKDQLFGSEGELSRQMAKYTDDRVLAWFLRAEEEEPNFDPADWADEVLFQLNRQVIQMASDPETYSGHLKNLRDRYELAALANFVKGGFLSGSDVATAVHALREEAPVDLDRI